MTSIITRKRILCLGSSLIPEICHYVYANIPKSENSALWNITGPTFLHCVSHQPKEAALPDHLGFRTASLFQSFHGSWFEPCFVQCLASNTGRTLRTVILKYYVLCVSRCRKYFSWIFCSSSVYVFFSPHCLGSRIMCYECHSFPLLSWQVSLCQLEIICCGWVDIADPVFRFLFIEGVGSIVSSIPTLLPIVYHQWSPQSFTPYSISWTEFHFLRLSSVFTMGLHWISHQQGHWTQCILGKRLLAWIYPCHSGCVVL